MILVDTNVLARVLQAGHLHQMPAINSLALLRSQGCELVVAPQTLVEFYSVATRLQNGLDLTPEQARSELENIKKEYPLLLETPAVFQQWEQLLLIYKPTNRQVFDMRLVACMLVNQIATILTYNDKDFRTFTEIQVLNPFDVLSIPRV